jgi:hypothetical protein
MTKLTSDSMYIKLTALFQIFSFPWPPLICFFFVDHCTTKQHTTSNFFFSFHFLSSILHFGNFNFVKTFLSHLVHGESNQSKAFQTTIAIIFPVSFTIRNPFQRKLNLSVRIWYKYPIASSC